MSNGDWQQSFGGKSVAPSTQSYEQIDLAVDTALVWPLESSAGTPSVAPALSVVPAAAALSLAMPDATQGSTGVVTVIRNGGNVDFTLTDTFGNQICVIAPGISWLIWLTDNGTAMGTWLAIQLGAGSSNAQAGALAGAGLQALGDQLQSFIGTFYVNVNTFIDSTYRASGIVWEGTATPGTLQLDAIENLTTGWWALFNNEGTEEVTLSTSGGDTINGVASITLPVGGSGSPYSVLVVAASDGFNTFAGTPPIIPISGGGTGADNAGDALINLGGSAIGIEIFEAPNAAAILAILGISGSAFTELTVATDQVVTADSINTAYVATVALDMSLPDTTLLTKGFVIAVYAFGGDVTLIPESTDKINGGADGADLVMPQGSSLLLTTDANGAWWPFFFSSGSATTNSIPWVTATGTVDAISAAYTPPQTELTQGLLLGVRAIGANLTDSPVFNVDGLGAQPIKKYGNLPLLPGDIPGADAELLLRYNSTGSWWELLNPATEQLPWVVAGGVADALTGAYAPAVPALTDGLQLGFRASANNATATPTFSPNGIAAQVITQSGGLPLSAGNIVNLGEYTVRYNLADTRWELLNPTPTSSTSQMHGQTISASGNFVVPANASISTVFKFRLLGAGGGGGSGSGGSGNGGGGGGSGGYIEALVSGFTGGSNVTVVIGAGGTGSVSSATDGVAGATSKVTYAAVDFLTCTGGGGGQSGTSGTQNPGGAAGAASENCAGAGLTLNALLVSSAAQAGNQGGYGASNVAGGGMGGSNPLGQGGATTTSIDHTALTGQAGAGFGSGGAGGATGDNPQNTGGAGRVGVLIVEWVL